MAMIFIPLFHISLHLLLCVSHTNQNNTLDISGLVHISIS